MRAVVEKALRRLEEELRAAEADPARRGRIPVEAIAARAAAEHGLTYYQVRKAAKRIFVLEEMWRRLARGGSRPRAELPSEEDLRAEAGRCLAEARGDGPRAMTLLMARLGIGEKKAQAAVAAAKAAEGERAGAEEPRGEEARAPAGRAPAPTEKALEELRADVLSCAGMPPSLLPRSEDALVAQAAQRHGLTYPELVHLWRERLKADAEAREAWKRIGERIAAAAGAPDDPREIAEEAAGMGVADGSEKEPAGVTAIMTAFGTSAAAAYRAFGILKRRKAAGEDAEGRAAAGGAPGSRPEGAAAPEAPSGEAAKAPEGGAEGRIPDGAAEKTEVPGGVAEAARRGPGGIPEGVRRRILETAERLIAEAESGKRSFVGLTHLWVTAAKELRDAGTALRQAIPEPHKPKLLWGYDAVKHAASGDSGLLGRAKACVARGAAAADVRAMLRALEDALRPYWEGRKFDSQAAGEICILTGFTPDAVRAAFKRRALPDERSVATALRGMPGFVPPAAARPDGRPPEKEPSGTAEAPAGEADPALLFREALRLAEAGASALLRRLELLETEREEALRRLEALESGRGEILRRLEDLEAGRDKLPGLEEAVRNLQFRMDAEKAARKGIAKEIRGRLLAIESDSSQAAYSTAKRPPFHAKPTRVTRENDQGYTASRPAVHGKPTTDARQADHRCTPSRPLSMEG